VKKPKSKVVKNPLFADDDEEEEGIKKEKKEEESPKKVSNKQI